MESVCCCRFGTRRIAGVRPGTGFWRDAQSARKPQCALPELPYRKCLEAHSGGPGVRPQSNEVSVARHAYVRRLRAVPREAGVQQRRPALPGLPRRHSQAATGSQLRAVPHSSGLAGFDSADSGSQQPLPANGSPCCRGLRLLPQGRGEWAVPDAFDAMLFVPLGGFHLDHESEPRGLEVLDHV